MFTYISMGCLTILWVCVLMVNDIHTQDVNSLYGLYTQFIYESMPVLCITTHIHYDTVVPTKPYSFQCNIYNLQYFKRKINNVHQLTCSAGPGLFS